MSYAPTPLMTRSHSRAPALRLLQGRGREQPAPLRGPESPTPALHVVNRPARVLLAGADAGRRALLLDELSETLPSNTVFEQADAVCEALEQAPGSRLAFIAGDLHDAPAESLMQTLAHRHPELPVLVVDQSVQVRDDGKQHELRAQHA